MLWCDNKSTIALSANLVLHARTKHLELDLHFVRDKILSNSLSVRYVPTFDQIADILTKPLSAPAFLRLRSKLSMVFHPLLPLRGNVREELVHDINIQNSPEKPTEKEELQVHKKRESPIHL